MSDPKRTKTLVLHVEVPGVYVEDLPSRVREVVGTSSDWFADVLFVVLEELMRPEVGLTLVTRPGQEEMSSDSEVHAFDGLIVGAEVRDRD